MKRKYKVIFWKPGHTWFLVCTRTYWSCVELALKQVKLKRAWLFVIKRKQ